MRRFLFALFALSFASPAIAQWQTPNHSVPLGRGTGTGFNSAAPGAAGTVMMSNGASSDPSFQSLPRSGNGTTIASTSGTLTNGHYAQWDGSGNIIDGGTACCTSGTVASGTANQLSYYASTGAAVAGLVSANNSVLTTNGSGVPAWGTTLPTITGVTTFSNTTDATSTSAAAVVLSGGLASAKSAFFGGNITLPTDGSKITINGNIGARFVKAATGEGNWFFANAGNTGATGNGNIAIGNGSLGAGTSAYAGMLCIGVVSCNLHNDAAATYSTVIGAHAADTTTSIGSHVSIFGAFAGVNNTADASTFVGYSAGKLNTSGAQNTAVGSDALSNNVTGAGNTAVGLQALLSNTGSSNTAMGVQAGYFITSGTQNTMIGYSTGWSVSTGSNNTIIGANVHGLAAGLTGNIILAIGDGTIKAQYDATNWNFTGAGIFSGTYVKIAATTVGSLPTCNAGTQGARAFVTNSNVTTFGNTVAAGGSNKLPVTCDGTNWIVG